MLLPVSDQSTPKNERRLFGEVVDSLLEEKERELSVLESRVKELEPACQQLPKQCEKLLTRLRRRLTTASWLTCFAACIPSPILVLRCLLWPLLLLNSKSNIKTWFAGMFHTVALSGILYLFFPLEKAALYGYIAMTVLILILAVIDHYRQTFILLSDGLPFEFTRLHHFSYCVRFQDDVATCLQYSRGEEPTVANHETGEAIDSMYPGHIAVGTKSNRFFSTSDTNGLVHFFDMEEQEIYSVRSLNFFLFWARIQAKRCRKLGKPFLKLFSDSVKKLETEEQINTLSHEIKRLKKAKEAWRKLVLPKEAAEELSAFLECLLLGNPYGYRGLLLCGPPGTGKTLLATTMAKLGNLNFLPLNASSLKGSHVGESEKITKKIWDQARECAPSILFIDECEGVFSSRAGSEGDSFDKSIVRVFLSEWDGGENSKDVVVVGATNHSAHLDEAILSRFSKVVTLPLPDSEGRAKILSLELENFSITEPLPSIVGVLTQGLSGRDLRHAASSIAQRVSQGKSLEQALLSEFAKAHKASVSVSDTSSLENLVLEDSIQKTLSTYCELLRHREVYRAKNIGIPKGLLLFGPPGTGKTEIARAFANELKLPFFAASTADLKGRYLGHSGHAVKALFERARSASPSVLCIDELDIVAPSRSGGDDDQLTTEIVGQLLQELDGVVAHSGEVFLIGISNVPDEIDSAVLSRFTKRIEVPLPRETERASLFRLFLKGKPMSFDLEKYVDQFVEHSKGKSGRDIKNLLLEAETLAVSRSIDSGSPEAVSLRGEDILSSLGVRSA